MKLPILLLGIKISQKLFGKSIKISQKLFGKSINISQNLFSKSINISQKLFVSIKQIGSRDMTVPNN